MEYWKSGNIERGYGKPGILLGDRVLSISKNEAGEIVFSEENDGFFKIAFTKEEAKRVLEEAILWIDLKSE